MRRIGERSPSSIEVKKKPGRADPPRQLGIWAKVGLLLTLFLATALAAGASVAAGIAHDLPLEAAFAALAFAAGIGALVVPLQLLGVASEVIALLQAVRGGPQK